MPSILAQGLKSRREIARGGCIGAPPTEVGGSVRRGLNSSKVRLRRLRRLGGLTFTEVPLLSGVRVVVVRALHAEVVLERFRSAGAKDSAQ